MHIYIIESTTDLWYWILEYE